MAKFIKIPHGRIKLPFFMPDATRGFIKLSGSRELNKVGAKAIVVNTFHLYLQPGMKIIKKAGGIHSFMNWNGPILSDSGGFQVFSLIHKNPQMGKIYNNKVEFKSPLDGSRHILTPEKSIQIQFDLGVDMMVCLDDCPPNDFNKKALEKSVERTISWAERCKTEYNKQIKSRYSALRAGSLVYARGKIKEFKRPLLFSVIQGGADLSLRERCARELIKIGFDGYGFGARPVDGQGKFLGEVLKYTADLIPRDAYKFALGIGLPEDIVRCAQMGWEMFDCVIPTREGRHGRLFFPTPNPSPARGLTGEGRLFSKGRRKFYNTININNAKFARDFSVINENSRWPELREYTKAYLHHLFKLKEPLGQRLASLNNLEFYLDLMGKIRQSRLIG